MASQIAIKNRNDIKLYLEHLSYDLTRDNKEFRLFLVIFYIEHYMVISIEHFLVNLRL